MPSEISWEPNKNQRKADAEAVRQLGEYRALHAITLYVLSGPASSVWGVCVVGGAAACRPILEQWETDRQQTQINTCLIGLAGGHGRPPTAEGMRK